MVTFELLSLNTIKESEVLKGVLRAQKTTDVLSFFWRLLYHKYNAVSPRAVKYALTGNGSATKAEMQQAAYELTGHQFPELLTNDHLADAFGMAFYYFSSKVKEEINLHHAPVPEKYAHMTWLWK